MSVNISKNIKTFLAKIPEDVALVAVSKTKPNADVMEAYEAGQRIFGENKIQEMTDKWEALPKDIEWHMIGHVQTNKVKYMAPYVSLIHAVDKLKLLKEINKRAKQNEREIRCLLQLKIAEEDSKFGMSKDDLKALLLNEQLSKFENIKIVGLMGMATFTDDEAQIEREFSFLKKTYDELKTTHPQLQILSMGMSGDYKLGIQHGSNMIRIGSAIFGKRN
ncbi:YggS family pyridoxal phosphate-dependent enzyme [Psychroflexus planctonicus]|uniref:Pyridoxal phosphate homeostasis protein n=1 Tax=Psychroflexus planctonicus TaxID=1526575 RepID=A0ABQ1SG96_9FLAO|nr:YggS family pyridoxal phosphate-dependent enzyme [Psychroflexus planctonicus]GGE30449.1 YggS family pyridoxal phosphate enzyme [Psychroflexus planctonicus]